MTEKKVAIRPIGEGTALDHLPAGTALKILDIIKPGNSKITVAVNVESKKMGRKDLLFMEDRFLDDAEIDKISLLAKGATLNIIKGEKIVKKEIIDYPHHGRMNGIIKCINPNCISNREAIKSKFDLISESPLKAKCFYCETIMDRNEIVRSIE